jgi:hypothetical protein
VAALESGAAKPAGDPVEASPVGISGELLGLPYRRGGTDSTVGMDCSGLVFRVMGLLGVVVPRDADDRFERAPFRSRVGRACPRTRIEGVRPRALAGPAARLEDGGSVPARRARYAHKTGELEGVENDGGIFLLPGRGFALAVPVEGDVGRAAPPVSEALQALCGFHAGTDGG